VPRNCALDTNDITAGTSLLIPYNQNPAIYHCPADRSTVDGYPGMLRKRSYNVSNSDNCTDDNHFRVCGEIPSPRPCLSSSIPTKRHLDSTFGTMPRIPTGAATGSTCPPTATGKAAASLR